MVKASFSEYNLNKLIAEKCAKNGTFEYLAKQYTHILPEQIIECLSFIPNKINIFKGRGIDLGGGPGLIAHSLASLYSNIFIDSLEIVEEIITLSKPIVEKYFSSNITARVNLMQGSFDETGSKDNIYDFCIAWDSMHHSNSLVKTLTEANRITKPGGYFILVDRAHNNDTPQEELDRMENIFYPTTFLEANGLPTDLVFSRKDNGEHEYRHKDWLRAFHAAGWDSMDGYILVENHLRNNNYINDFNVKQIAIPFELGGFERRKIVEVFVKKNYYER